MIKKILGIASCLILLLGVSACREEIKSCSGSIKELNDSVMTTRIGEYEVAFDITQTRYDNGLVQPGDSVNVHYLGDLRSKKAKAVIINLVPRKGKVVDVTGEPDFTKELKTKGQPMSAEEQKAMDDFVRESKKHGH